MVSVCIATFNGEKYIHQQLQSILLQLNNDDEIIISDDCSTDATLNIVRAFNDSRIKVFANCKFSSPILNFENALKNASGKYIFLCDQDDVWLPDKVSTMIKYLDTYDLVVSDCKVVDENLKVVNESFFKVRNSGKGFLKNLAKNSYIGCCMAFKNTVLRYALPFPTQIAMHDIWLGLLTELYGETYFLDSPLILYRRHGNNASFGGEKSGFSLNYKVRYRLIILYLILKRRFFKVWNFHLLL